MAGVGFTGIGMKPEDKAVGRHWVWWIVALVLVVALAWVLPRFTGWTIGKAVGLGVTGAKEGIASATGLAGPAMGFPAPGSNTISPGAANVGTQLTYSRGETAVSSTVEAPPPPVMLSGYVVWQNKIRAMLTDGTIELAEVVLPKRGALIDGRWIPWDTNKLEKLEAGKPLQVAPGFTFSPGSYSSGLGHTQSLRLLPADKESSGLPLLPRSEVGKSSGL